MNFNIKLFSWRINSCKSRMRWVAWVHYMNFQRNAYCICIDIKFADSCCKYFHLIIFYEDSATGTACFVPGSNIATKAVDNCCGDSGIPCKITVKWVTLWEGAFLSPLQTFLCRLCGIVSPHVNGVLSCEIIIKTHEIPCNNCFF